MTYGAHPAPQPRRSRRPQRTGRADEAGLAVELEHHLRDQAINVSDVDALIFQAPGGGPLRRSHLRTRVWVPACARAGLVGVGFHDLRRTNATILVALGTSIRDAQELLGHDDPRMLLGVYAQATETGKRAAVDSVSAALEPSDSRQSERTEMGADVP